MGYNYEIHYKPGKENVVVDALSRIDGPPNEEICAIISFPTAPLISKLHQFYATNPAGQKLIQKAQEDPHMQQKFSYKSQLLYFKDRLFIPLDSRLIPSILTKFHASPVGGHSGVQATLSQISASFY